MLSYLGGSLNEQDNLVELHSRISATIAQLGINAEIVVVDDGSTDDALIAKLKRT